MGGKGKHGFLGFLTIVALLVPARYLAWRSQEAVVNLYSYEFEALVEVRKSIYEGVDTVIVGSAPVTFAVPARKADVSFRAVRGPVTAELEFPVRRWGPRSLVHLTLETGESGSLHSESGFLGFSSQLSTRRDPWSIP